MSRYKPYPAYEDSGVEWIGKVPKHWQVFRLANIGRLIKGNGGTKEDDADEGMPCIRYGDLYTTYDSCIREIAKFIRPESAPAYSQIQYGDVLLAASGETLEEIGKSCVNLDERPAVCGGDVIILRPTHEVEPTYLGYAVGSTSAQAQKSLMGKGFTVIHVYGESLRNLIIASPPRDEQRRIALVLSREMSRIDALIAKKSRFLELLREKIIALASPAPDEADVKWVKVLHACDVISRPVQQQVGSSYTKLGLFNRGRGIFKKDETDTEDMGESEFFWVNSGDLILSGQFAWEGAVALADDEHDGSVVSHRFHVLRGRKDVAFTECLFAYFLSKHGEFVLNECSRGSAGRNRPLNINLLLNSKIPVLPMRVQKQIARLVKVERLSRDRVRRSITLLKERRSALITAAVTGQIDLREAT